MVWTIVIIAVALIAITVVSIYLLLTNDSKGKFLKPLDKLIYSIVGKNEYHPMISAQRKDRSKEDVFSCIKSKAKYKESKAKGENREAEIPYVNREEPPKKSRVNMLDL